MQNEEKPSIAALMSAFVIAYHTLNYRQLIYSDEFSAKIISEEEYNAVKKYIISGAAFFEPTIYKSFQNDEQALRYIVNKHLAPTVLCRAAYCENAAKAAVLTGTNQVVILGCGLDTFSFKNRKILKNISVFELDRSAALEDKQQRIIKAGIEKPDNIKYISYDFAADDLRETLLESGFQTHKKTLFIWLGVSYYLYCGDIEKTLSAIAAISDAGSEIVFDYADAGLFLSDVPRVKNMLAMAKASGGEMRSSFDYLSIDSLLSKHSFLIYEICTPSDIQKQIINPNGCDITAFENINYITAVLQKQCE